MMNCPHVGLRLRLSNAFCAFAELASAASQPADALSGLVTDSTSQTHLRLKACSDRASEPFSLIARLGAGGFGLIPLTEWNRGALWR